MHEFRTDRARPLLGTIVKIGIAGLPATEANAAIDRAFASIAEIHALMSFHEFDSDISRLNREGSIAPVVVHRHTANVIRTALEISAASAGIFDITIAPTLVEWGLLPAPSGAPAADPRATWRDIEFVDATRIRFRRPLWIDLGGIAKGYAVDTAIEQMNLDDTVQRHVNAGGDVRVAGPKSEQILLQVPGHAANEVPMIELSSGCIASSSRIQNPQSPQERQPHVHGIERCAAGTDRFVSVLAETCIVADALTKVAIAAGPAAADTLKAFRAQALLFDQRNGWQSFGYEH
jgi:thiamine biosynthesis lipoprotein